MQLCHLLLGCKGALENISSTAGLSGSAFRLRSLFLKAQMSAYWLARSFMLLQTVVLQSSVATKVGSAGSVQNVVHHDLPV